MTVDQPSKSVELTLDDPSIRLITDINQKPVDQVCKKCGATKSAQWWKCCARHTTANGPDVMCENCAIELHPGYEEERS